MKKVLIFTASIGGGHNEAALCLERDFVKHNFIVRKYDVLLEMGKNLDFFVSHSYKILIDKFPKVYGNLYDISNKEKTNKLISGLISKVSRKSIYNIILEESPDLIITTHCFVVGAIGYLKENNIIDIPFISIVTDYEVHQAYINENVDAYIISNDHIAKVLEKQGISKNKIFPYGMPIKIEFLKKREKKPIEERPFRILLMGGSLGFKGMKKVLKEIAYMEGNYQVVVICGKNIGLKEFIGRQYYNLIESNKILLYGFTNNISDIMDDSDIIITKPGGLTISEAIAKRLPIIVPYYIPGHEKENLDFLLENGLAIYVDQMAYIKDLVEFVMENPEELEYIRENMERLYNSFCPDHIVHLGEDLIENFSYEKAFSNGF